MATIRQGSCVGILYRPPMGQCKPDQCQTYSGSCHCVHNGRFVGAVTKLGNTKVHLSRTLNTSNLKSVTGVLLRHWSIGKSSDKNSIFLEYLFFPVTRLESIDITPFKNLDRPVPPPGNPCSQPPKGSPRKPNTVYPGDCVGIRFRKPNKLWDIKNGKYLFWQKGSASHCQWNTQAANNPDKVWYSHWIVRQSEPHFESVATNRGPQSSGMETGVSLHPITGYNPKEGSKITITFLDRTRVSRIVTYS